MDRVNTNGADAEAATHGVVRQSDVSSIRTSPPASNLQLRKETPFNGRRDDVSIDDFQFNASLDALLDGDNLDDAKPAAGTVPFQPADACSGVNGRSLVNVSPPQGLLTAETTGTSINKGFSSTHGYSRCSMSYTAATQSYVGTGDSASVIPFAGTRCPTNHPPDPFRGAGSQQCQKLRKEPSFALQLNRSALVTLKGEDFKAVELGLAYGQPKKRSVTEVSEDEDDRDKRRHDRNLREQQRSHRITQQISQLRDVLASADIQFKPDKYSTLVTVSDYIKQLQARSTLLDTEHKNLIATIAKTNEVISNQYVPASATGKNPPGTHLDMPGLPDVGFASDEADAMVFARGIDYKCIFARCGVALAVASIDGRFLDCNKEFERLTCYQREELLPREKLPAAETPFVGKSPPQTRNLSLFNLLIRDDMEDVFVAMSEMLKHPSSGGVDNQLAMTVEGRDSWTGTVHISRVPRMSVSGLFVFECFVPLAILIFCFFGCISFPGRYG